MTTAAPPRVLAELRLPYTPRSLSQIPEAFRSQREFAAPIAADLIAQLRDLPEPAEPGPLAAAVCFSFSDRRPRVADNFVPLLDRALRSALVDAGFIDDPDDLSIEARIGPRRKSPATRIVLEVAE